MLLKRVSKTHSAGDEEAETSVASRNTVGAIARSPDPDFVCRDLLGG